MVCCLAGSALVAAAEDVATAPADDPAAEYAPDSRVARRIVDEWMARAFARGPAPPLPQDGTPAPVAGYSFMPEAMRRLVDRHQVQASIITDLVLGLWDARQLDEADLRNGLIRELEFALGAHFTPTIRGDVLYSIEREEDYYFGAFEEAYVSFLALPLGFQARVGKKKAAFGKANQLHTHALPWIDRPAPLVNIFGEEGLAGTGVSISHLVPNPWEAYSEIVYQAFNLSPGTEIGLVGGRDATQLVHWTNVFDLSDATTLEVGMSAAHLTQAEFGRSTAEGLDVTLKWRPVEEGLYRSLTWQNELYAIQNRVERDDRAGLWGAYSSAEYQFARRWSAGMRMDFSQVAEQQRDQWVYAPFLTFRQTERMYYRLQFTHSEGNPEFDGRSSNDVRLQFDWSLGSHRPHAY
jgi:hypothetical protein